jgi:hypothetical protein
MQSTWILAATPTSDSLPASPLSSRVSIRGAINSWGAD